MLIWHLSLRDVLFAIVYHCTNGIPKCVVNQLYSHFSDSLNQELPAPTCLRSMGSNSVFDLCVHRWVGLGNLLGMAHSLKSAGVGSN